MRWAVVVLLMTCTVALAEPKDTVLVRTFYGEYAAAFAAGQKSEQPTVALLKFLRDHQAMLEPGLYKQLLLAEQPWASFEQHQGPAPPLVCEHDLLSGSAGDVIKNLKVGLPTPTGVPVSFATTDMQGQALTLHLTVVVKNGQISDVLYQGDGSLRGELREILKPR